ncbi:uncharacterized protein A4U43_C07F21810 [Asparagus officinalis]|uniref:Protein kinase domain-containing protein n=1 Tax=Asparagus officinalis TaxID=4686 RepID=A0A5P1EE68_ASPOF|nr:probable LRR receptor-like serine/threonine-protein kinase At1g63430 [Asparagus officinalis]ONK64073.1 uncharacterized protein A4U43_C07F21810 [Asparagus officinalis]
MGMMSSMRLSLLLLLALKWGFIFVPSHSFLYNEVLALKAIKKAIFEDPLSVLSDWNPDGDPCNWSGVICSKYHDHVLSLNLSHSSLKGFLAPELGSLSSLQELILDNNYLLGTIPKQIGELKNLTVLDLSVNRFSGPIPPEVGNLTNIRKINLQSNGLTGNLPPELGKLMSLVELRLDRNRLHGPVPGSNQANVFASMHGLSASHTNKTGLCWLPELKVGDFSYNFFDGKIPSCLLHLPRSSFQGNCFQDKHSSLQRSSQMCNGGSAKKHGGGKYKYKHFNEESKRRQPEWLLIMEVTTGVLIIVFCITATITALIRCSAKPCAKIPWKKTTNWKDQMAVTPDGEMLKNVSKFSRQDLEVACEDFSNIIGSSPNCIVYKGTIKDGLEIAVVSLCISEDQWTNYFDFYFQTRVADLARINHENTARLLGYCKESDPLSRMLVFEYASNGTLYEYLHYGEGYQLSWLRRMRIVLGIARGLRYLHTELQPPFAFSELNSSTVYLTEDFSPKVVDFDSWKMICSKSEKNYGGSLHSFFGSFGQRQMDIQGNTFSFGVLLLEIISGRPPYCKDRGRLVDWAMENLHHPEDIIKLVDPELKNVKLDDLEVICSVVSLCIEPDPSKRPSMQIISGVLENGIDTSEDAILRDSSLAWAELALSS